MQGKTNPVQAWYEAALPAAWPGSENVMTEPLETVLLLALPASGKSEVRRYLANIPPAKVREDFHMGPTVQLDDFPYVHLMRRIDEELIARGWDRVFFASADKSFRDATHWGTLIELLNEDYADLVARRRHGPGSAAKFLLERLERASQEAGASLAGLDPRRCADITPNLERECATLIHLKEAAYQDDLRGKTVVIEFARGGRRGAPMPLEAPYGYRYSLSLLSPSLLERASVLYVWVTPEDSRRKNTERANPHDPGSILHHGVPLEVMLKEYGCDDMDWLEKNARHPGTICVERGETCYDLPIGRFDNRADKTSFVRADPAAWQRDQVAALHEGIRAAVTQITASRRNR